MSGIRIDWRGRVPHGTVVVESSMDGRHWTKVHSGRPSERALFTALGRHVRVQVPRGATIAEVELLGTR